MNPDEEIPRLRMVPRDSPEEIARRFERERRVVDLQRESRLAAPVGKLKIGSVPYLNAVPLTRGLEEQVIYEVPSKLARMLEAGELDAALVSITEVLLKDRYDVLDGMGICSLGEVKSVLLAHRRPIEEVDIVWCDPASLTSVSLLKVLLAERGLRPEFRSMTDYREVPNLDYVLLIGDVAIEFVRGGPSHAVWDLGEAWYVLTGLPFVYAVWALRRGVDNGELRALLREAYDFGLDTLDALIADRTEFDLDFRRDYLGWHIHFHMGSDEKRGIARFLGLLEKHGLGPVYPPRLVS